MQIFLKISKKISNKKDEQKMSNIDEQKMSKNLSDTNYCICMHKEKLIYYRLSNKSFIHYIQTNIFIIQYNTFVFTRDLFTFYLYIINVSMGFAHVATQHHLLILYELAPGHTINFINLFNIYTCSYMNSSLMLQRNIIY